MTKKEEFTTFIQDNKEVFYRFLIDNEYDSFPFVCTVASEVLFSYIHQQFPDAKCLLGDFITNYQWVEKYDYENEQPALHCWIKYEDLIVDFTLFQFLADWEAFDDSEHYETVEEWKENKLPFNEMFNIVIKPYQSDVFIDKKNINHCWFVPYESLKPRFKDIAKNKSFTEYLNTLSNFKKGKCDTIIKKKELKQLEEYKKYNYEERKILSKRNF